MIKHIVLAYLAFVLLLSSVGVSYDIHTCLMSNEKQVSVFVANDHCDTKSDDMHSHCKNDNDSIKRSCCKIDKGLIQSDITIPIQQVNSFHPVVYFVVAYFESFQNKLPLSATFKTFYSPDVKPKPKDVQVWQQVFRC